MSKNKEEILRKLKEIAIRGFPNVPGKVVSVDEGAKTCVVSVDDINYEDIRLNSVIAEENETHSYIVPVVGSWVMVSFVEGSDTDAYLSAFSEIDKVIIKANLIELNGGEQKGIVKAEALISKLNAIENDINLLKQALSNWTPVAQDGGAALKTGTTSWAGQQLQKTKLVDIENEKIKQ